MSYLVEALKAMWHTQLSLENLGKEGIQTFMVLLYKFTWVNILSRLMCKGGTDSTNGIWELFIVRRKNITSGCDLLGQFSVLFLWLLLLCFQLVLMFYILVTPHPISTKGILLIRKSFCRKVLLFGGPLNPKDHFELEVFMTEYFNNWNLWQNKVPLDV